MVNDVEHLGLGNDRFDVLLRGGHVIDPKNGISEMLDVAVQGGRIARVGGPIPAQQAAQVIDVSGHYVIPGLIDMHVHVYGNPGALGRASRALDVDTHSFPAGVTTMVDAGTSGAVCFGDLKESIIDRAKTRVLAFLNIVDLGMVGDWEHEARHMKPSVAAGLAKAYPQDIVGIKTAHYWTWPPFDADHQPWTAVDRALEASALCSKPVMVDFWPRPERPYEDLILRKLQPGDIHTHVFAQQFPIVDAEGKTNPALWEARERGVLFDVGHGAASFWFRNAVPAARSGFVPDSISTDLHPWNAGTGLVGSNLNVMSKFLNMGLPLDDVIKRATVNPARAIGCPELGNLDVGVEADIAVVRVHEGRFGFIDCGRAKMLGTKKLECVLTLRRGEIVFDPQGLSMPAWEQAPEPYWVCKSPVPRGSGV